MKIIAFVVLAAGIGAVTSWWLKPSVNSSPGNEKQPLYWVAPMDPDFRRDQPGLSPMGMELVPVYEENRSPGEVSISAAVESQMGVTTATAERLPWLSAQSVFAEIKMNNQNQQYFQIRADGWIEKAYVFATGEAVKAGQPLFDFYSRDLVVAQEEFLVALADGEPALISAARNKLKTYKLPKGWIQKLARNRVVHEHIRFVAKHAGIISAWNLPQGRQVKRGEQVLTITDLSSVWLEIQLTKPLVSLENLTVRVLHPIEQELDINPDSVLLSPLLNTDRTQTLRFNVNNPQQRWRPGDYLTLMLQQQLDDVLQIPSQAIIDDGIQQRVVLALTDENHETRTFKSVAVNVGRESQSGVNGYSQKTEILAGLSAGDRVVTSGQFLLDSESSIDSDLLRFYPSSEQDIIWFNGKVKLSNSGRLDVQHQGVAQWSWPAMRQNFHLALDPAILENVTPDLNNWSQLLRIKLAALDDGDFCVVDIQLIAEEATP
ncbi:efflux RND transporter periplasmic adaptor subunit [Bacterioplanoides sp.]|uniref:efflux RND transporter periplasmic adaptor subunit n=1 Tax=Bacterioplanoides sp. TaxID=2066072 RepID=UPI003B008C79